MEPVDVSDAPVRRPGDMGKTGVVWQPGLNQQNRQRGFGQHPGSSNVQVLVSGPALTGMLPSMVDSMLAEMRYALAAQALADVQLNLDQSIQHPTPYYETQITLQERVDDWVVHDRGIAYGPWLEGVSQRNRTTKFKGYHAFRRAVESATRRAPQLLGRIAREWIGRMGG